MTDRDIMQQALEALQKIYIAPEHEEYIRVWWPACEDAITALRERLAQPEQDAVLVEREACAKVCDLETALWEENSDGQVSLRSVAAVIRARGNT